jgi:hypothetical protein
MTLKIEGYELTQLETLGKSVETVDTRKLSISGDAQYVAQVYLTLGLFAPVVQELKKRVDAEGPVFKLTREQENARISLGITEAEALEMANSGKQQPPAVSAIVPSEALPFGFLLPKDGEAREHAVKHLRWVLHSTHKGSANSDNLTDKKFASWMLGLYDAFLPILTRNEMAYVFAGAGVEKS